MAFVRRLESRIIGSDVALRSQRPMPRALVAANATKDRVLRYPDGNVRHIRYPVSETMDEDDAASAGAAAVAWDVAGFAAAARRGAAPGGALRGSSGNSSSASRASSSGAAPPDAAAPASDAAPPAAPGSSDGDNNPSSSGGSGLGGLLASSGGLADAAAYLEGLFGSSYADAQPPPAADIADSYRLLDGCPWPVPRPVYVLTVGELRPGSEAAAAGGREPRLPLRGGGGGGDAADGDADGDGLVGSTYTLRTKVVLDGTANQLAALLGRAHLASALEVAHMRDGVVTFETPDAAARFATRLEEDGARDVTVAEVDSHRLFRLTSGAQALVVLVSEGADGALPAPFQLAAALKGQRAWDDM